MPFYVRRQSTPYTRNRFFRNTPNNSVSVKFNRSGVIDTTFRLTASKSVPFSFVHFGFPPIQ